MSQRTGIEWCDSTVNPMMGCAGCELWIAGGRRSCYAGLLTERQAGAKGWPKRFEDITLFPGRMEAAAKWGDLTGMARADKPWLNGYPRLIFVADMGDLFCKGVSWGFIYQEVMQVAQSEAGRRHIWILVTKRPKRLRQFDRWMEAKGLPWPRNVWALVTVTSSDTLARLAPLLETRAVVRGVSAEPLVSAVDLGPYLRHLSWVIGGGESGLQARACHVDWARGLRDQCEQQDVPFFWKQWGQWLPLGQAPTARGESNRYQTWPDGTRSVLYYEGVPHRLLDGVEHNGLPLWDRELLAGCTWDDHGEHGGHGEDNHGGTESTEGAA